MTEDQYPSCKPLSFEELMDVRKASGETQMGRTPMIGKLKEIYERANRELPKLYSEAQEADYGPDGIMEPDPRAPAGVYRKKVSAKQDHSKWDKLKKSEESFVGEARKILRQILPDFERTAASDGSWDDAPYCRFMEYNPRRLVETYCSDKEGLSIDMDYSLPKLELEAERFAQRINVPRPSWNRMLSEEERKNRPTGTKVDVWETLEQLVK